jgi:hypothetical protein
MSSPVTLFQAGSKKSISPAAVHFKKNIGDDKRVCVGDDKRVCVGDDKRVCVGDDKRVCVGDDKRVCVGDDKRVCDSQYARGYVL